MNPVLAAILVSVVAAHGPAVTAESSSTAPAPSLITTVIVATPPAPGVLAQSVARAVEAWSPSLRATNPESPQRSWAARHPALLGAMIGAAAGAGIGYAMGQECTGVETEPCSSRGGAAAVGAAIFGGAGAVVGVIVGRMSK